ncbi:MAG TPA: tryptophan 2,3-dioxygenase family protein [Gemmatimonadaceae bacterium]|nr:tryptophan 2,3-dioxygenase family protein [Gemmatimonadaceae bacterium]
MSDSGPPPRGGRGDLTYGSYLALDELLRLQRPQSRPEHPDELLFIVVHQASELWFRVILHELDGLIDRLEAGEVIGALTAVKRVNALVSIVAAQLSALETLPPQHFAEFRGYLGTSSGSQSEQFRAIEAVSGTRGPHFMQALGEHGAIPPLIRRALERPTLQELFERVVAGHGTTVTEIYRAAAPSPLFLLAEGLLEYEQGFALWRFLHVQLVERIIGPGTGGTGGTLGARYLQRTISQRFFPILWEARTSVFEAAEGRDGPPGAAPG